MSQLRNPVETCGWCGHPLELHDFLGVEGPMAVPCPHCPGNICDLHSYRCTCGHFSEDHVADDGASWRPCFMCKECPSYTEEGHGDVTLQLP